MGEMFSALPSFENTTPGLSGEDSCSPPGNPGVSALLKNDQDGFCLFTWVRHCIPVFPDMF